jgi:dGTPase
VAARYPGLETPRLIHESVRRLIDRMVSDLVEQTRRRLEEVRPGSVDDIRRLGGPVVAFSPAMREKERALKQFLFQRMYRHERVMRAAGEAKLVVRALFDAYLADPSRLPAEWRAEAGAANSAQAARLVADYIAGMTDPYAFDAYRKLTEITQ